MIASVSSEQRGVVGQADGGDLQVHRADAHARALQTMEVVRGVFLEREDRKFQHGLQAQLKSA